MSEDARFEDGEDKALNIGAFDKRDLEAVSYTHLTLPTKQDV